MYWGSIWFFAVIEVCFKTEISTDVWDSFRTDDFWSRLMLLRILKQLSQPTMDHPSKSEHPYANSRKLQATHFLNKSILENLFWSNLGNWESGGKACSSPHSTFFGCTLTLLSIIIVFIFFEKAAKHPRKVYPRGRADGATNEKPRNTTSWNDLLH